MKRELPYGATYMYVDPGDEITVKMPVRGALHMPPEARRTIGAQGIVTKDGGVRMLDGTVLPSPSTHRLRRER